MNRVTIPRGTHAGADVGVWFPMRDGAGNWQGVLWCCPCGRKANLGAHTIEPDGTVNASVVCPHHLGRGGCGFHEFIRLADYDGPHQNPGKYT